MELKEFFIYRNQLLDDSKNEDGYITEAGFLEKCLPALNETRYIESEDVTNVYEKLDNGTLKVNAYTVNESEERLQLFLVNEDSLNSGLPEDLLMVSHKSFYDKQMNRALSFVKKSIKKQLNELLQDGSPALLLTHQLGTSTFLNQIDVVEIFLLSATATIEARGAAPSAKMLEFEEESITVSYTLEGKSIKKNLVIIKRLIDLNFLYNVQISEGSRYPLVIDFTADPFHPVPFLHAANEADFDSYLCALPAKLLAELYKKYSSRMLEKNVRSFLQLKGVNKGMQETIRLEPEKFIAYNNGLTITATASEIIEYKGMLSIKSLTDFQVVNGGQTTATIYFSQKAGLAIDSIRVMAKINVARNASDEILDDLISKISTFSNAQSKVSKVDLRSRNTQLVKLKSLSESVVTLSGKKWFFERAKGEFATLLRINSKKKAQIEKMYPKERRFTKEDLAKYYSAWGNKPFAVKRGGEKIFRLFLEEISGEGKSKKNIAINRHFYEDLIARIILFRTMEKIYGQGSTAIGQLRSAVVPYSISALYEFTTASKSSRQFDLLKIWKCEKPEEDLQAFFRELMKLMNKLIRQYGKSDDLGEYAKKEELWNAIADSVELKEFMVKRENKLLIEKYLISAEEQKRREKEASQEKMLDFEPLSYAAEMFDRGREFYIELINTNYFEFTEGQLFKLREILSAIQQNKMIEPLHIQFEQQLLKKILLEAPEIMPEDKGGDLMKKTVHFIIRRYNAAVNAEIEPEAEFLALQKMAKQRGVLFYSVFSEIGRNLQNKILPTMLQVIQASEYVKIVQLNTIG